MHIFSLNAGFFHDLIGFYRRKSLIGKDNGQTELTYQLVSKGIGIFHTPTLILR